LIGGEPMVSAMLKSLINTLSKFGSPKTSKEVAKERLKLVLIHDRANVSPQFLEMVKSEIIKVISNYMYIEEDELDIKMTRIKSETGNKYVPALVANIPIKSVKSTGK
jgi:cell division topological specificity factor